MKRILMALAFVAGVPGTGHASEPWLPTPQEARMLPPMCQAKVGPPGTAEGNWADVVGPTWVHFHHYCVGLNLVNRVLRSRDPNYRRHQLGQAVNEMTYTISRSPPDLVLLPEMLVNRGQAQLLNNRPGEAVRDFTEAIRINPRAQQAYIALADYFAERNQKSEALKYVTEGLRHLPDSRGLKRRYDELGGKKPYPEPYAKSALEATETAPPVFKGEPPLPTTKAPTSASPHPATGKSTDLSSASIKATRDTVTPEKPPPAMDAVSPKRNPYCRFCPEEYRPPDPGSSTPKGEPTAAP